MDAPREAVQLGIMAKAPVAGLCKTRLCPPLTLAQAAELHRAMLEDTVDAALGTGARVVLFAAPEGGGVDALARLFPTMEVVPQAGASLGARMDHALDVLLSRGLPAALLGTDAPHAPLDALVRAVVEHRWVMGPADDGGYWTLGVHERCPWLLEGMPWSTPVVASETRARALARGVVLAELPTVTDVDDAASLGRARPALERHSPRTRAWLARPDMVHALGW